MEAAAAARRRSRWSLVTCPGAGGDGGGGGGGGGGGAHGGTTAAPVVEAAAAGAVSTAAACPGGGGGSGDGGGAGRSGARWARAGRPGAGRPGAERGEASHSALRTCRSCGFFLAENHRLEWLVKHCHLMINVSLLSLYVPYVCWLASIIIIFACHFFLDALSQGPLQFWLHAGQMKLYATVLCGGPRLIPKNLP